MDIREARTLFYVSAIAELLQHLLKLSVLHPAHTTGDDGDVDGDRPLPLMNTH